MFGHVKHLGARARANRADSVIPTHEQGTGMHPQGGSIFLGNEKRNGEVFECESITLAIRSAMGMACEVN